MVNFSCLLLLKYMVEGTVHNATIIVQVCQSVMHVSPGVSLLHYSEL